MPTVLSFLGPGEDDPDPEPGALLRATRLDLAGLGTNALVRGHFEACGDRQLYFSIAAPEVVAGGMSIARILAVTDSAVYKIPQTAAVTGIFRNCRMPLSGLRRIVVDNSGESHNVSLHGIRGSDGDGEAGAALVWTLQFRKQDERRRKECLLILFHLAPDVPVVGAQAASEPPTPPSEPLAPSTAPNVLHHSPPRPRRPEPSPIRSRDIAGDLSLDDLRRLIPLVLSASPAASGVGRRRGSVASDYPNADYAESGEARSGYQSTPCDAALAGPSRGPSRIPLTPAVPRRPSVSTAHSHEVAGHGMSHRSAIPCVSSVLLPEGDRATHPADTPLGYSESPSPRRVSFFDTGARHSDPGATATTAMHPRSQAEEIEQADHAPEQQLSIGDLVEVRDTDAEPWKEGRVTRLLAVPVLIPMPGDRSGQYLTVQGGGAQLLVAPEGTEQAFTWRHVRVPDAEELARRRRDRQEAEEAERRMRAEQEERHRIREMLRSKEARLAERLQSEAEDRAAVAERIRSRQPRGHPRVQLAQAELRAHAARIYAEDSAASVRREQQRRELQDRLEAARRQALADARVRAFSVSPPRSAQWSPQRSIPDRLRAEAAAAAQAHAREAARAAEPHQDATAEAALVECDALRRQQEHDFRRLRSRAREIRDRDLGGPSLPSDRILIGAQLHALWLRWRSSDGGVQQRSPGDGHGWSDEESVQLSRKLRALAGQMTLDGRRSEQVARVRRMADAVDRSRAAHRAPPGGTPPPGRKTEVQPFSLSEGRRPPQQLSATQFREELRLHALESRANLVLIRQRHAQKSKQDADRRRRMLAAAQRRSGSAPPRQPPEPALSPPMTAAEAAAMAAAAAEAATPQPPAAPDPAPAPAEPTEGPAGGADDSPSPPSPDDTAADPADHAAADTAAKPTDEAEAPADGGGGAEEEVPAADQPAESG